MTENTPLLKQGRKIERLFLLLTTVILGSLFVYLFTVLQRDFKDVPARIAEGTMLNLNSKEPGEGIRLLLEKGYYFDDQQDIELIKSIVSNAVSLSDKPIDNIGELNKRRFFIDAETAFKEGGESFWKRVLTSRALLGFNGDDSITFFREQTRPRQVPSVTDVGLGKYSISGEIKSKESKQPVAGVLVRLEMILPQDSAYSETVTEV